MLIAILAFVPRKEPGVAAARRTRSSSASFKSNTRPPVWVRYDGKVTAPIPEDLNWLAVPLDLMALG